MTRAALRFIEIDFGAIAATVGYWFLLERGWWALGKVLVGSLIVGPGVGLVLGWIWEEDMGLAVDGDGDGDGEGESERLLQ